jgi:hypothetical protein
MISAYCIDALADERWETFLSRHLKSSVFHTSAWLKALQQTYGYKPAVLTTTPPGEPLADGLVFCEVKSWITGRRLVSLPFSDHCEPLSDSSDSAMKLLARLGEHVSGEFSYAEARPLEIHEGAAFGNWQPSSTFCFHLLSLDAPSDQLFRNFHKDCIQRKVRRAEREDLRYEKGRSEQLLQLFYGLMLRTRRRQGLPPQPIEWFRNLISCFGDNLTIHIAFKSDREVAAILTLSHKDTITYKYGCSDEQFNQLGATPFLFWRTIQEAKDNGMCKFDLGRSDMDNEGLITFKGRLGATRSTVTYWRYPSIRPNRRPGPGNLARIGKYIFSKVPDTVLIESGRLFYRHMG